MPARLPPAAKPGYGVLPSMKLLLVGLGTGTYCIHAAAVFQGSASEGLLLAETPQIRSCVGVMSRSA